MVHDEIGERALLRREATISATVNAVLSLVFFLSMFGSSTPAPLARLAVDALPQTFMVTLMAALVPAILVGRRRGGRHGRSVLLAITMAVAALAVLGGGTWLALHDQPGAIPAAFALAAKVAYGAVLGALVTRVALARLLARGRA